MKRLALFPPNRNRMSEIAPYVRFLMFGTIMAFVNVVPYLLTRGAYATDGVEIAGWPLDCYAGGGFTGRWYFSEWAMAGNIVIAMMVSALGAWMFRDGERRTLRKWWILGRLAFRKLRTWGTPSAE